MSSVPHLRHPGAALPTAGQVAQAEAAEHIAARAAQVAKAPLTVGQAAHQVAVPVDLLAVVQVAPVAQEVL